MPDRSASAVSAALPPHSDGTVTWRVGASLAAHALLLVAALVWRSSPPIVPEVVVSVALLSAQDYAAETGDRSARVAPSEEQLQANVAPSESSAAEPESAGGPDRMIRPRAMLSAAALADPRSRQAREMLPTFDPTERTIQLCDIEAMEQVRAWKPSFRPERLVAYASAEVVVAGDTVRADGAAFFSGGAWYAMRFDCGLSADHLTVVSFAFQVGEPIPRSAWEAHSLPTGEQLD